MLAIAFSHGCSWGAPKTDVDCRQGILIKVYKNIK